MESLQKSAYSVKLFKGGSPMIFSKSDHIQQIINGTKTVTRRPSDRYKVGGLYKIQPGRGKKGIPDGRIYIGQKYREWKPDLSDLPEDSHFIRRWRQYDAGYPIRDYQAKMEGGYTPDEYEELYEKMYPGWTERWVLYFCFFTVKELADCGFPLTDFEQAKLAEYISKADKEGQN